MCEVSPGQCTRRRAPAALSCSAAARRASSACEPRVMHDGLAADAPPQLLPHTTIGAHASARCQCLSGIANLAATAPHASAGGVAAAGGNGRPCATWALLLRCAPPRGADASEYMRCTYSTAIVQPCSCTCCSKLQLAAGAPASAQASGWFGCITHQSAQQTSF